MSCCHNVKRGWGYLNGRTTKQLDLRRFHLILLEQTFIESDCADSLLGSFTYVIILQDQHGTVEETSSPSYGRKPRLRNVK